MVRGQIGQDFSNIQSPSVKTIKSDFNVTVDKPQLLKDKWDIYKAVSIPNLFPQHIAEEVWEYYYNQPNENWNLVIHPDPYHDYSQDGESYYMYLTQDDDPTVPERLKHARRVNKEGGFSYVYRRTDHLQYPLHPHLNVFQHPKFLELLEFITGHENLIAPIEHTFISNYGPGHYNGPHSDGPNGRIAFVYHLSNNWRPEYGGVFMRMEDDYLTVNKAVVPKFNTLTMFDVSKNGGSPHLVSEVVEGCDNKRISYTGWYQ